VERICTSSTLNVDRVEVVPLGLCKSGVAGLVILALCRRTPNQEPEKCELQQVPLYYPVPSRVDTHLCISRLTLAQTVVSRRSSMKMSYSARNVLTKVRVEIMRS
jgi:hypothetical protein